MRGIYLAMKDRKDNTREPFHCSLKHGPYLAFGLILTHLLILNLPGNISRCVAGKYTLQAPELKEFGNPHYKKYSVHCFQKIVRFFCTSQFATVSLL